MTNFNETAKNNGVNTYGYDITEVTKYLSDEMADRFAKAAEDMQQPANRAFVQACYSVLMQMKSVSSTGKLELSDSAIEDTYRLLLAEE